MTPKTGRPIEGQARKDIKLQIRVDRPTLDSIDELAKKLGITRTGVMMKGIELVRNSLDK